jgi:hypothetical protein
VGLRYIKVPLANFTMMFGRAELRLWGRPSRTWNTPTAMANLLPELTRKAGCDSDSGA